MTRETRVGLLIGLVFIFAFGLVLGELTNEAGVPRETAASLRGAADLQDQADPQPVLAGSYERARRAAERASVDRAARRGDERSEATADRETIRPRRRTYVTCDGDTLIAIARRHYGPDQGGRYLDIFRANRDVISDPGVVPVGVRLVIP